MEDLEKYLYWAIIAGLVGGMFIGFGVSSCSTDARNYTTYLPQPAPDTIWIKEFIPVEKQIAVIKYRYLPAKVIVYDKPDTARRKAIEADTLITGVKLYGNELAVQTITPAGISQVSDYKLPEPSMIALTLDHKGNIEVKPDMAAIRKAKRKERWRKIGNWVLNAVAFGVGVTVGTNR